MSSRAVTPPPPAGEAATGDDKGDYDAAEPLLRRALAIGEKAQGPEHPSTGTRLNNLGSLLQAKGDYDAAEPLYRRGARQPHGTTHDTRAHRQ